MGLSSIETPLIYDYDNESQVSAGIPSVKEDHVILKESSSAAPTESQETLVCGSRWRIRSGFVVLAICGISAVIFHSAAFVPFHLRSYAGDGQGENVTWVDSDSDYYEESHTSYHYQPQTHFMGDPCAPMFYQGYYHLFYQYNPHGAIWGTPYWGHTVSTDLIHWKYLDFVLAPDRWYDLGGTWSGSATILQDGTPVILYTGGQQPTDGDWCDQTQNMALPVDPTDPLLREWRKVDFNPILVNPDFVRTQDFRDPSTGWLEDDGLWRLLVGSRRNGSEDGVHDGIALMYTSSDFIHWKLEDTLLHAVEGVGMWECVDLYPVSIEGKSGLNHSVLRAEHYVDSYKYVMKVSVNDIWTDNYAIGTYSTETHTFTPDDPAIDVGIGLRYDYGRFYGSRTFYDSSTGRRILWGYSNESQTERDRYAKGWSGVQVVPRAIWLDGMTHKNILQWPIEEVDALRGDKTSHQNVQLQPEDVIKVTGADGPQLDILVVFEKPNVSSVDEAVPDEKDLDCGERRSADRGVFGPFGLLVRSDDKLIEQTAVFFYISLLKDGRWATRACSDLSRSTLKSDVDTTSYGSQFIVLPAEKELSLRILTDHSFVETFVQGGRMAITSRVYPTVALGTHSRTFLFNNATTPIRVKSLDVYQMGTVTMTNI